MMTWWGEAMGSLVLMDGELFAANKINDAFVVISTDGHPDVPVNYENQPVGKTNNNGYLLVSGVSAYYPASYSIDTLNLPADTRLKETERRIAIRRHSGYLVDFPMEQERVASVILHDARGQAIPVGSQVRRARRAVAPVVGYDGIAWLENLSDVNALDVTLPDGKTLHRHVDRRREPATQAANLRPAGLPGGTVMRLLLGLLLLFSGGSWAACTVSTVNASFGSVTSFALSGTGEVQTTGTLVVACDAGA
ncbi:fimbrial biogenesis outer membrane usher protein [Enterobacter cancerogenus]|uniref:Fimbrial biogenesis outer membrane usher protein n=1 Tax=Enterobacter cancerogenus TaxID=69218 RepID=A0A484Y4G0_9ENTR|nr:fimbrial biogenesis outer membrane usher protein [Enterobacter cancerogenus]